jgi:hypothetical protein
MVPQFREAMKRHSFVVLRLLMLIVLGASLNACMIANYPITAQEPKEGRAHLASKDDVPVYIVIPQYYKFHNCGRWVSRSCRDATGTQLEKGVSGALWEMPFGRQAEFTEHIPSQGLVCVVTVNEQPVTDAALYSELLSALTLGVLPLYATREYVLSYTVLFDFKTVREYQYNITRKAIRGVLSGVLVPFVYPFWGDEIAVIHDGPDAKIIKGITSTVFLDTRRDGIFKITP